MIDDQSRRCEWRYHGDERIRMALPLTGDPLLMCIYLLDSLSLHGIDYLLR